MQVLPGAGRAEFLWLKLRPEAARTTARRAAEHAAQNILKAAPPAATRTLETVMAEVEVFEATPVRPPAAAWLRAIAFEAAEARFAFGVDLAAIERFAFLVVAGDLIGSVKLGEARGRLGIVLVGVGMQLLSEPPVGALNLGLVRTLRYPQYFVGVAHSV